MNIKIKIFKSKFISDLEQLTNNFIKDKNVKSISLSNDTIIIEYIEN